MRGICVAAIIAAVCAAAAAALSARASATLAFVVNTTSDTSDVSGADLVCKDASNKCSLRAAVEQSNYNTGAQDITLPSGTFTLTRPITVTTGPITINGAGKSATVIAGSGHVNSIGFRVESDGDLTLSAITVRRFGTGLSVVAGTLTMFGAEMREHTRNAISNLCVTCTVTLNDTEVHLNASSAGDCPTIFNTGFVAIQFQSRIHANTSIGNGGAVCNLGGKVSVFNAEIHNNLAAGFGGAVYQPSGALSLLLAKIEANQAGRGGGIFLGEPAAGANTLAADTSDIVANTADYGGGIYKSLNTTAVITNTNIMANGAITGGGVYARTGWFEMTDSAIISNTAELDGGGVHAWGGYFTATNSTISRNTANANGAGMYVRAVEAYLSSVTIAQNTADLDDDAQGKGGGVYESGDTSNVRLKNSILAGNEDLTELLEPYAPDCLANLTLHGYNLIGKQSSVLCNITGAAPGDLVGGLSPGIDPVLGPIALADSATYYHKPLWPSPAIDGGDPAGCRDFDNRLLTWDQRGLSRPAGAASPTYAPRCDMGAVESAVKPHRAFVPSALRSRSTAW